MSDVSCVRQRCNQKYTKNISNTLSFEEVELVDIKWATCATMLKNIVTPQLAETANYLMNCWGITLMKYFCGRNTVESLSASCEIDALAGSAKWVLRSFICVRTVALSIAMAIKHQRSASESSPSCFQIKRPYGSSVTFLNTKLNTKL